MWWVLLILLVTACAPEPVNTTLSEIVTNDPPNSTKVEESVVEDPVEDQELPFDDLKLNYKYQLRQGEELRGIADATILSIKVEKVKSNGDTSITVNGVAKDLSRNRVTGITEHLAFELVSSLYNDPEEPKPSLVIFKIIEFTEQHYPEILIERDIGNHLYNTSKETGDDEYRATYGVSSARVTLVDDGLSQFKKGFHDPKNIIPVGAGRYIYLDGSIYTWPAQTAIVEIRSTMDYVKLQDLLIAYLEKYPSLIDDEFSCSKKITLQEKQNVTLVSEGGKHVLEAFHISDKDQTVRFKIDGELTNSFEEEESYRIESLYLYIEEINVEENGIDSITLCHD